MLTGVVTTKMVVTTQGGVVTTLATTLYHGCNIPINLNLEHMS